MIDDLNMQRLFARQTLHEYLLETMHLNIFLSFPDPMAAFKEFRLTFLARMEPPDSDDPLTQSVAGQASAMAQNFLDKVHDQLRDHLAKGDSK